MNEDLDGEIDDVEITWELIREPRNQADLQRREWWHKDPELFEAVLQVFFVHDPIKICQHRAGVVEYSLEVNTILPRLVEAEFVTDVTRVIEEEFGRRFGPNKIDRIRMNPQIADQVWTTFQASGRRLGGISGGDE